MHSQETDSPRETIVIPLFDTVVYPRSRTKLPVDPTTGEILTAAVEREGRPHAIGLSVKSGTRFSELTPDSLYRIGALFHIRSVERSDEGYLVCVDAVQRVKVLSLVERTGGYYATYEFVPDIQDIEEDLRVRILADIKLTIHEISSRFTGSEQFTRPIDQMDSIDQILGFVMPFLPASLAEKHALLEIVSVRQRSITFLELLIKTRDTISIRMEMAKKVSDRVGKSNREAMLREQLRAIQEELGEGEGSGDNEYLQRIEESDMPEEVRKKALAEIKKLENGGSNNHESGVIRNYLDLLLDLPWVTKEIKKVDLKEARRVLDGHHNGLEKVKERIVQHLAVMKLKAEKQGSIILLAGPPGTGKTSLGKSVAEALGRKYVRISLGGIRDEAEIRGHRRTYVGALPGRIIAGMKKAGTKNPVFILDEVDKLGVSYAGDPSSALLEVLDPEQNSSFTDHYLEVPYDLSEVLFIATANSLATIPAPLLDRMELIEISGYTKNEKFAIAKDHLIPATLSDHGLTSEMLRFEDEAIRVMIERYTREAGVRQLKNQIAKVARHVSEKIVSGDKKDLFIVTPKDLDAILGKEPVRIEMARKDPVPGVVTGLAWTPVGGEILFVEGTFMPGSGKLTLTGQLGEVMKESATIAASLIRSRLAEPNNQFNFMASDIHVHVPAGATPKDGPSAGVTISTSLASLITGRVVDPSVAMTGEITLSGAVLPVGGIREKVLAAHRAGIKKIILPKDNSRDLEDVPADVRNELEFVLADTIDDVLKEALGIALHGLKGLQTEKNAVPAHNL